MTPPAAVPVDRPAAAPALAAVAAVVPAFAPGRGLVDLVTGLLAQTPRVVVVDDTGGLRDETEPDAADVVERCRAAGAVVVRHERNLGIGAALTTGVERARDHWPEVGAVLTVDQDSRLAPDHLRALLDALHAAEATGLRVGLVGPEIVEGLPSRAGERRGGVLLGLEPVQSGLLVPLAVLDEVGGLDTGLVIDGVDSDLWLKVLDTGRAVVVASGLRVGHRLGSAHVATVFGRPVVIRGRPLELTVSAPFRSYYLVRNRLRLVRRHGRRHPGWAVGQLVGLTRHLVLVLAFVPGRRVRLREVGRGIRDAVAGRDGRRPETA